MTCTAAPSLIHKLSPKKNKLTVDFVGVYIKHNYIYLHDLFTNI